MMPYLNGFEVMEQLISVSPPDSYLPILVLTADITPEAKQRALSGGAKDFLSKPFDLNEVSVRIKNLLETRYLHQLLENQNQILEEKVKERTFDLETAYQKLDKANEELKVLDQAKIDFLRLISHEIRTPLNGIRGFTYILKSTLKSPELLEYLQYLEMAAIRLEQFSFQALLITELRSGNRVIPLLGVPLIELIDKARIHLKDRIAEKAITILVQRETPAESITGDSDLLHICFDSLIDNAVKYSPENETITVRVFTDKQFTVCEFIDNGPGFSTTALSSLYGLFGVGDAHIDKNTGLNLALIKLIMDAHQGQIEVRNNPEKGATVTLSFLNCTE